MKTQRGQNAAKLRAKADDGKVLGLHDAMTHGKFAGAKVKDVIEHNPFHVRRLVNDKEIALLDDALAYLRRVYNAMKGGRNW